MYSNIHVSQMILYIRNMRNYGCRRTFVLRLLDIPIWRILYILFDHTLPEFLFASILSVISRSASGGAGVAFVEKERSSNSVLIRDYPGHGSLWCYRRFICQAFLIVTPPRALIDNSLQAGVPDNQAATLGIDRDAGAGDPYDWPGWNRATTQWYEGCVRADAMAQDTSSDEDSEGYTSSCEGARGEVLDYEKAEGALPGAPAGGGALAEFLGQEARFALKCATDKVGNECIIGVISSKPTFCNRLGYEEVRFEASHCCVFCTPVRLVAFAGSETG